MGEIAQTFTSEIEWLAVLKSRATGCCPGNEGAQHICEIDFGPFNRCKVYMYNIYYKIVVNYCSKFSLILQIYFQRMSINMVK